MDNFDIAYKMREANCALRSLYGDEYDKTVSDVKQCIAETMKDNNINILPAAIALMKAAEDTGNENHVIWFLSAAYDMIIERKEPVK